MPCDHHAEWEDSNEEPNLPEVGYRDCQRDHHADAGKDKDEGEFEVLDDLGDFLKKGRVLGLLGRRAPRHVDAKQMAENGLADVQGDAAEEDGNERQPLEVLNQRRNERLLFDAVTEHG